MPETLIFENESGSQITDVTFRRTIKGIPSLITKFYLKNQSSQFSFNGRLNVVPTEGRSYSEDLYIARFGSDWVRGTDFEIPPGERIEFKMRAKPVSTPAGNTGRAALTITIGTLKGWY